MVFFRNFEGIFEIQNQSAVGNAEVRTNLFEKIPNPFGIFLQSDNFGLVNGVYEFDGEFESDIITDIFIRDLPYYEMVAKLFWPQFVLFVRYFVKLAQNDFRRSRATPQS